MNIDTALRPTCFNDYIGQASVIERLRILVSAARTRRETLGHVLLSGPPGLGKTTLAHIIANEMGMSCTIVMGPGIEKPADIQDILGHLGHGILFIDEIHRVPASVAECLYEAMEDRKLTVMTQREGYVEPVTYELPPLTIVGATTQPGLLEPPLRDRFGIPLTLGFYSDADLAVILSANAAKLGMSADADALLLLASRSRGTPRISNHLLRFARDYVEARGDGRLTLGMAEAALKMQGIDAMGLSDIDRQYLAAVLNVYKGGPVGADALAATLGVKSDTVTSVIEPYMLVRGLIVRTSRGRKATDAAATHLATAAP